MTDDKYSTESINRKFINNVYFSEYNKYFKIKQELNTYLKRNLKPTKQNFGHQRVMRFSKNDVEDVKINIEIPEIPPKKGNDDNVAESSGEK